MSFLKRQWQAFAAIFQPPFEGLGVAVVLFFAWCFLVYPNSQILRGNLPDPDDYMYLTQVIDWMHGQGWYDNIQHRLNPPSDGSLGGTPIHFSRLAQLPMAALMLPFEALGLGPHAAATLMALIYPLILFGFLLFALRRLAASVMPRAWAGVTAYVTLFSTGMTFMFTPGHVDHHGLIIVLVALALGFAMRMLEEPADPRYGLAAGLTLALGLVVALEILPWMLLMAAGLGIWAMAKGRGAARNGLAFGLALYLGSFIGLALTRPPARLFEPDVLTYSVTYVLLTGGIAVGFAGVAAAADRAIGLRWMTGLGLAGLCGFLFLHRFPELITGPYGGMDSQLARIMLGEIDEARPLAEIEGGSWLGILTRCGGACVALGAGLYFLKRARGDDRWRWSFMLGLLIAALSLTLFYQYRFTGVMGMLAVVPLAVLLQRGWKWIGAKLEGRIRIYAEIGLLLLVGPLPSVLFPAVVDGRSFNTGVLLFPVDAAVARTPCDTYQLERILKDPRLYGDKPRLLMSAMGQGPELLFRTPHAVLSAPFHMDVSGNIDATRFFSTPYASEAEAIARRRHVDLVVACRYVPEIYTRSLLNQNKAANDTESRDTLPHFIELLMTGRAPGWLKPTHFPNLKNFVIYEVAPEKAADKKPAHAGG